MLWFSIAAVLIVIFGFILLIIKKNNRQLENGFAINFMSSGLALIVDSFGTFSDKLLALINKSQPSNNYVQLVTGAVLIAIGFWMKRYIKKKISILNMLGVKERRIEEHSDNIGLNPFEFKEHEIDLSLYAKKEMNQERYDDATELIKYKVDSFRSENKDLVKGYTGTAPIPLTLYAGYCFKGGPITKFYEYNRFEGKYNTLKKAKRWYGKNKKYPTLKLTQALDDLDLQRQEEVVLGVSLTMPITTEQVRQFNGVFIHLSLDEPRQNVIEYVEQLNEYVKVIFDTLMKIGQHSGIKRIHLVISSQSCLVFELGKQLTTETYMKEIINYHFVNNAEPNYVWGLAFNNQGAKFVKC
ncbi:SAVED domain-containing protein [Bacillus licheniformis]|uniref:SAVED domain-containing protein n=1 Tax=Bacillus licheniformis TaxID=1402 RepID=UPI0013E8D932|nr:SAVED domain-containing protein [Bacillus licheniformis]MEC5231982.1 SAVED domain-containing protein [Bacillus licheniformis]